MPDRWMVMLRADQARPGWSPAPKQVHGLAVRLFEGADADHEAQDKPYSAGTPVESGEPGLLLWRPAWLRDSGGPDPARWERERVRLGSRFFTVEHATARHTSYAELGQAAPAGRVEMRFAAPTYFSRGDRWFPLPDPVLMYGRLAGRWNAHAPDPLRVGDAALKELTETVAISAHDITTRTVDLGRGGRAGFTGTVTFVLAGRPGEDTRRLFAALSWFAAVAGVGAATTYGLGAVEVSADGR